MIGTANAEPTLRSGSWPAKRNKLLPVDDRSTRSGQRRPASTAVLRLCQELTHYYSEAPWADLARAASKPAVIKRIKAAR
jgi:hypothetical protein